MSTTHYILMVMYDYPATEKNDIKAARILLRTLTQSGFYALQASIYIKPLSEKIQAETFLDEIKKQAVEGCHIRALLLTHQAFVSIIPVAGQDSWGEMLIKKPDSVIRL